MKRTTALRFGAALTVASFSGTAFASNDQGLIVLLFGAVIIGSFVFGFLFGLLATYWKAQPAKALGIIAAGPAIVCFLAIGSQFTSPLAGLSLAAASCVGTAMGYGLGHVAMKFMSGAEPHRVGELESRSGGEELDA